MKVISVNTNGIRAAQRKGFFDWMKDCDPDVVCIQETKAQVDQLEALGADFFPAGYHCQYVDAQKKGYSGVAIYSKVKPFQVIDSLNHNIADHEGRYLQFDFDGLSIASLYMPSGTSGDERQAIKYQIMDVMVEYLTQARKGPQELIICGDWNIAHTKNDIKNWRGNQKNSGFLPEEREWMTQLFGPLGFVDAFRVVNQEADQYTWWSNRGQAWANNVGWRIDYQVITPGLKDKVQDVAIYKDQRFSDHAPLIIDYDHPLS